MCIYYYILPLLLLILYIYIYYTICEDCATLGAAGESTRHIMFVYTSVEILRISAEIIKHRVLGALMISTGFGSRRREYTTEISYSTLDTTRHDTTRQKFFIHDSRVPSEPPERERRERIHRYEALMIVIIIIVIV